jgi:hypothetical protein
MNMLQLFKPGDTLYGYCNGFFGRDDYERKICVAVRPKYAVFEYEDGNATVLNLSERLTIETVEAWKTRPSDDE